MDALWIIPIHTMHNPCAQFVSHLILLFYITMPYLSHCSCDSLYVASPILRILKIDSFSILTISRKSEIPLRLIQFLSLDDTSSFSISNGSVLICLHFFLYPCHNYIYKILLLHFTQFSSRLHLVPFPNTLPAACSSCVLCYKYGINFLFMHSSL